MRALKDYALIVAVAIFFISGCAGLQGAAKAVNPWDMTFEDRFTWAVGVYNIAYDDYHGQLAYEMLSDAEREMLKKKRAALVGLRDSINLVRPFIGTGQEAPLNQQEMMIDFVNRVQRLALEQVRQ